MNNKEMIEMLHRKGILDDAEVAELMGTESCKTKWAQDIVSKMHHTHAGVYYSGEKYSVEEATAVYHTYKHALNEHIKPYHVYIALNAQYHDYCGLFKDWYLDDLDGKIRESAMSFWFMDEDYEGCKVEKYFNFK